jgi:ABC-2 type transport system permease protein
MNVYRREMRASVRPLTLWTLGVLFFIGAAAGKFSAVAGDASALDLFNGLPMGMQALFGIGVVDFSLASGFYAIMYSYLVLMAAIHAAMLGAVILSKEERDKTTEFLYVKPASRTAILTAKLLAALTQVLVFALVNWIAAAGFVAAYGESAGAQIAELIAGMLLIQLVFLSLGIAAAAVLKWPKAATGVATGAMLTAYFLSIAIDLNGDLNWMTFLTPFAYFDAKDVVGAGKGLSIPYALLCVGLAAALTALSYLRFRRRDLQV